MTKLETIGLTNGHHLRVGAGLLMTTRPGRITDALKSFAAIAGGVVSFLVLGGSLAAIAEGDFFPSLVSLPIGFLGLYVAWSLFRSSLGAIAGVAQTVMEIRNGEVILFGESIQGRPQFTAWKDILSVFDGKERIHILSGLVPEEATALASHLNQLFFDDLEPRPVGKTATSLSSANLAAGN